MTWHRLMLTLVTIGSLLDWLTFESGAFQSLKHNAFFFSKFGTLSLLDADFTTQSRVPNSIITGSRPKPADQGQIEPESITLVFGSETVGLHKLIGTEKVRSYPVVYMPMLNTNHRVDDTPSFNLAASVAMGLWEAYRQDHSKPLSPPL